MLIPIVMVLTAAGAPAQAGPEQGPVLAAHRAWIEAMVRADVDALRALYAEDLVYVHGSGAVETRTEFLEKMTSGARRYLEIASRDPRARLYGGAAIVTDRLDVVVGAGSGGEPLRVSVRSLNVFVRRDGVWRLVAHQATRLPESIQ